MSTPLCVAVLGAGKVGRSIARALRQASHPVSLRPLRKGLPVRGFDAELLLLAVRDGELASLAERLVGKVSANTAVVHMAGALGPEVLAALSGHAAGVGQAHPMISFASPGVRPALAGGHLLVSGDRVAQSRARQLAKALGMRARSWPDVDLGAYHAAGGLVANGAAALAAAGALLLERGGAPTRDIPKLLGPLLASVASNIEQLGLPEALTGPVRRGDAAAVALHLDRIAQSAPELLPLYEASVRAQLPMARALGDASKPALDGVERALVKARRSPRGRQKP